MPTVFVLCEELIEKLLKAKITVLLDVKTRGVPRGSEETVRVLSQHSLPQGREKKVCPPEK